MKEETPDSRATAISLTDFRSVPMRSFHLAWSAFFVSFFGWFGIAPLMVFVRDDLQLSHAQVVDSVVASVLVTVVARILVGAVSDRFGPRRTYAGLLVASSVPVMCIGLAHSYETFLLGRLAIGIAGASFVITQHHTSLMFAPNCVGTASATTAGWGNLGGAAAQVVMPLLVTALAAHGVETHYGWRFAMIVPGAAMLLMAALYLRFTQDTPTGNFAGPKGRGEGKAKGFGSSAIWAAAGDRRVWAMGAMYAACFGVDLTVINVAALYFHDTYKLGVETAGMIAGLYGLTNLFARTLGGYLSDRVCLRTGLRGRVLVLAFSLLFGGAMLVAFGQVSALLPAVFTLVLFGVVVKGAAGATYALIPALNRGAMGSIAGLVGAGGNLGAIATGLVFRSEALSGALGYTCLGVAVMLSSGLALFVRFSPEQETAELASLAQRQRHAAIALQPTEG